MTDQKPTPDALPEAIGAIVATLSARPEVAGIALGGSRAAKRDDTESDYDLYTFVDAPVPRDARAELARRFDPAPEIGNAWFGETDEWADRRDGVAIDLMFWDRRAFERDLRRVIEEHRPSLGYSTAFWFTTRHATPLVDRDGWFADMRTLAARPYPDALRRAIVDFNLPLLRRTRSSYRHQIELALRRDDPVSVQHRTTAFLASLFDIVFAAAGALHPGEKRLLSHLAALGDAVPADLDAHIRQLIAGKDILKTIDAICDDLDALLGRQGLGGHARAS
jgi:predicted nucleotidyltransferase